MERSAGVLLHISSLPGTFGIGTLGQEAYRFVDFLAEAGQHAWQILPINPLGKGFSPYQSPAVMKGNPLFIDLKKLCVQGLLKKEELPAKCDSEFVEYENVSAEYARLLELAVKRSGDSDFVQKEFSNQWFALKRYANQNGISIIGDLPIYAAPNSEDVLQNKALFQVDEHGVPTAVAGCPPDNFSSEGQMWNNPLYQWDAMRADGYRWWIARMRQAIELFDMVRIDHFRGFEAYWSIPYGAQDARMGQWVKGPGLSLFSWLKKELGELPIIAEDLGYITPEVHALRKAVGAPGMAVLQFAFDMPDSPYLPHRIEEDCVVYTGTHDNNTLRGWVSESSEAKLHAACSYFHVQSAEDLPEQLIRAAFASKAQLAIAPMQDHLRLDGRYRMNIPSTEKGNWRFRMRPDALNDILTKDIRKLSEQNGRM